MRDRAEDLQMDFVLQADSLFSPLVRFVFFKSVTAGHERSTVHDKYMAVILFSLFFKHSALSGITRR